MFFEDLAAQIEGGHQDQRDRDRPVPHAGEGREHDQHEYDAAGPQQGAAGEAQELGKARDKGRDDDEQQYPPAAVLLLHGRPDDQQQEHVGYVVAVAGMAQHVQEKPRIGQDVAQGAAVDAEHQLVCRAARQDVQPQRQERQQGKTDGHRGVVMDGKFLHICSFSGPARQKSGRRGLVRTICTKNNGQFCANLQFVHFSDTIYT